jgi:hypothetical protein
LPKKYKRREGHPNLLGYFEQGVPRRKGEMSWFRCPSALLGLIAVAVLMAGCGETVIDTTKTEEQLEANLSHSLNEKVSSVDCPSNQKVEKGATFTCSVNVQKGEDQTVTLKIRNSDADISVINISGANE